MPSHTFSIFPNEPYVDLTLYQYGQEKCMPLHSYGPFIRNHYLFHYILSGSGSLDSRNTGGDSRLYHLKAGQGFLICPNQVTTYFADEKTPWEYAWLEFDGMKARECMKSAGLTPDSPVYVPVSSYNGCDLRDEILSITGYAGESTLYLIGHLYLFLDWLVKFSSGQKTMRSGRLKDFYIREALSFIEQNYQNPITVEDIAKRCSLDRSYFGKLFKDAVSVSPQEFIIRCRMSKAAELLKLSNLPIGAISLQVGYPNQMHFSRAFKKEYGLSPRDFRK